MDDTWVLEVREITDDIIDFYRKHRSTVYHLFIKDVQSKMIHDIKIGNKTRDHLKLHHK